MNTLLSFRLVFLVVFILNNMNCKAIVIKQLESSQNSTEVPPPVGGNMSNVVLNVSPGWWLPPLYTLPDDGDNKTTNDNDTFAPFIILRDPPTGLQDNETNSTFSDYEIEFEGFRPIIIVGNITGIGSHENETDIGLIIFPDQITPDESLENNTDSDANSTLDTSYYTEANLPTTEPTPSVSTQTDNSMSMSNMTTNTMTTTEYEFGVDYMQ